MKGEVSLETNDVKFYYTMLTEQTSKYFLCIPQAQRFHKNFSKTAFCEDFDYINLAKVTSIFKSEKIVFCFLPCFSKTLERILHNRIYKYLTKKSLLFDKQFEFGGGHSTELKMKN